MNRQTATACVVTSATPEAIWSLVADLSTWTTWAPFETATLESEGHPDPNGAGAVRRFRRGRFTTREEVTAYVANRQLTYRLLSGLPLRDYEATIDIRPRDGQTQITWSSTFSSRIPGMGGAFRRGMQKIYAEYAGGLARAAESHPVAKPDADSSR
jgi:hypothetical protein